jgi:chloramphenicol O-acetyltransferase
MDAGNMMPVVLATSLQVSCTVAYVMSYVWDVLMPTYTITPEKQDTDLKSPLMTMIEDFKKDKNNSLKEIQENAGKQLEEALKEDTQKVLKELQENTIKQEKEMNKNHPRF